MMDKWAFRDKHWFAHNEWLAGINLDKMFESYITNEVVEQIVGTGKMPRLTGDSVQ